MPPKPGQFVYCQAIIIYNLQSLESTGFPLVWLYLTCGRDPLDVFFLTGTSFGKVTTAIELRMSNKHLQGHVRQCQSDTAGNLSDDSVFEPHAQVQTQAGVAHLSSSFTVPPIVPRSKDVELGLMAAPL